METQEENAQCKKINFECMKRKQLFETQEESAKCKKTMQECEMRQRQTETEEQGVKRKKTKRDCMRKKHEEMRHRFMKYGGDCTGEDMTNVINRATKEAKQFLHRTRDPPAAERMQKLRFKMSQKKRTLRGKRKDFPRMQNVEWKPRRKMLNAGRFILNV